MILKNVKDFNLEQTFECGQCFRWRKEDDGSYTGVIKEGVLNVKKCGADIAIRGKVKGNIEEIVENYFDLKTDYLNIKQKLCIGDANMKKATEYGGGIRILNQDPWEMLISFIISAANNIPRISKTIENISRKYGSSLFYEGNTYYLFPTAEELSIASSEELRKLNTGFRDKYILEATKLINENTINLEKIKGMPTNEAKKELMIIPGVGAKVADCILLFSMCKKEAFPVDTWIKKIMNELYIESSNMNKINRYATDKFGMYAGVAQQYLFYYKRSG